MSIMEISKAVGTTVGPLMASVFNYLFGYEGPFTVFGKSKIFILF